MPLWKSGGASSFYDLTDTPDTPTANKFIRTDNIDGVQLVFADGTGEIGSESNYPQVATYADLPIVSAHTGEIYIVQTQTGIWLINRKEAGLYRSNGTAWTYLGSDVDTTAIQVDSTKLVGSPITLIAGDNITLTPVTEGNTVTIDADIPVLADVATTGSYTDLSNVPTSFTPSTHNHDSSYAPTSKGVTNGDSHNHSGGDGAQIAYADISGTPTIPTIPATGIAFCLYGTLADNAESTRYVMKAARTATEIHVVSSAAPSSAITVQLYRNGTQLGSNISHSTTATTSDIADTALSVGDILYAKISGAANGITNITIEVTLA